MPWIWIIAGLVVLVVGADVMVRGASRVAQALGVSPLVVGLTVVAFGTSAPELAVSIQAATSGSASVAVGNIVGSNIANIWLILGIAALVGPLVVQQSLVRLEVPLLVLVSFVAVGMAWNGRVGPLEGAGLLVAILAYTVFAIRRSRREQQAVRQEYEEAIAVEEPTGTAGWVANVAAVLVGLAMLIVGGRWLVGGAIDIARRLGIQETIIGLTVVAVGTSLPEVATSVMAAVRGERDIAVGNVVGSNLFNLTCVLGATAMVADGGVPIPETVLSFDMWVMVAASVACLPVFFSGHRIDRWEGSIFLVYFAGYTTFVVLQAVDSLVAPSFGFAMLAFVVPMTLLALGVVFFQERKKA